MDSELDK
jgi:Lecithin:cholesterol acyltransferase